MGASCPAASFYLLLVLLVPWGGLVVVAVFPEMVSVDLQEGGGWCQGYSPLSMVSTGILLSGSLDRDGSSGMRDS